MKIVRLKTYRLSMEDMGLLPTEIRKITREIAAEPLAHPVIPGLRGARKARFALRDSGKSGGGRAVYYVAIAPDLIFFLLAFPKSEQEDLTNEQRKMILEIIDRIKGAKE